MIFSLRHIVGVAFVGFGLLAADRFFKIIAPIFFATPKVLLPSFLEMRFVLNTQLLFLPRLPQWFIIVLASLVMIVVSVIALHALWLRRYAHAGFLGLVLLGAWSNLLDRLVAGAVIDFIHVPWWSTFNLADVYIVCGIIGWFIVNIRMSEHPLHMQ